MKRIILPVFFLGILSIFFLAGCQTEDEQVQHAQDRKQDRLMKQMQKQQEQADQMQRSNP